MSHLSQCHHEVADALQVHAQLAQEGHCRYEQRSEARVQHGHHNLLARDDAGFRQITASGGPLPNLGAEEEQLTGTRQQLNDIPYHEGVKGIVSGRTAHRPGQHDGLSAQLLHVTDKHGMEQEQT
jgi:hypothetical protein